MGIVDHPYGFTGRVDKLVFYKNALTKNIIVRKAMGISAKRFKTDREFAGSRKQSEEFKGRTMLARCIYLPMKETIRPVFDHLFFNVIMSKLTEIQKLDTFNPEGTRSIEFNRYKESFAGLSFNNSFHWEQIISKPLDIAVNREASIVNISIPSLSAGDGFHNVVGLPYCRFWFLLSMIPDAVKAVSGYGLTASPYISKSENTGWLDCSQVMPATQLSLPIPHVDTVHSLMISSAISFGKKVNGKVEVENYVGAGRVEMLF